MGVAGWRFANKANNNGRAVVIAILEEWPVICSVAVAVGASRDALANAHLPGWPAPASRQLAESVAKYVVIDMFAKACAGASTKDVLVERFDERAFVQDGDGQLRARAGPQPSRYRTQDSRTATNSSVFDQLLGEHQDRFRDGEPECLARGFKPDIGNPVALAPAQAGLFILALEGCRRASEQRRFYILKCVDADDGVEAIAADSGVVSADWHPQ
jgi:hypothetical protein